MEISIYLTNLGKYNEGELVGKWFTLPIEDIDEALLEIGVDGEEYEEFFITDYESPFPISEYENLENLNVVAEELMFIDIDESVIEILKEYDSNNFVELMQRYDSGEIIVYENTTAGEYAEQLAEETGMLDEVPESLRMYINFDSMGRDMGFNGELSEINGAVVVSY